MKNLDNWSRLLGPRQMRATTPLACAISENHQTAALLETAL